MESINTTKYPYSNHCEGIFLHTPKEPAVFSRSLTQQCKLLLERTIMYNKEDAEDALTQGVTVVECSEAVQEKYYQFIKEQFFKDRITLEYFDKLVESYIPVTDKK
jgi:hypothetical protein